MQKIISYPISIFAISVFLFFLVLFHPIQWIGLNVFGYQAHKKSVDYLNFILLRVGHLLGTTYKIKGREHIPTGVPLIFVANHQSLHDIIGIIWFLRRYHPKFISKIELGKGIPSVSYNLKHGGSVLIDRKNPKAALPIIAGLGSYIEQTKRSAVIFPEGTRSRTGLLKEFSSTGLKILCKNAPSAHIVPITINNSWKIVKYGSFPYGLGNKVTFVVHPAFLANEIPLDTITEKTKEIIEQSLNKPN